MSQDLSFLDMSIVKVLWDDNAKRTSIDIIKIDNFYLNEFKNNINSNINNFNTDTIPIANSNKFITNNNYDNDLNISKSLISSNIFTSNLNVNSQENNIANFFYSSEPILIITSNNIGIGTNKPNYKLDINGSLNASNIFINNIDLIYINSNVSSNVFNYLIINSSNNIYSNTSNYTYNTSNKLIDYNNLINKPELFNSNNTSNVSSNVFNYLIINSSNNIYSNASNYTYDTFNKLIDYNNLINKPELFNSNNTSNVSSNVFNYLIINSSNNIYSNASNYTYNTSNLIIDKFNLLNTDTIPIGTNNKFIVNNKYEDNLNISGILNVSNIITSNITINGGSTIIETDIYVTEKLELFNNNTETSLIVKQFGINQNVAEFYNNTNPTFIITSNSNIGIGTNKPNLNYTIDIYGKLNANDIYINNSNISEKINNNFTVLNNFIDVSNNNFKNITDIINNYYCKKTTFYFTTTTSFIYNNITYYTYNIQLDKFIRFADIEQNNKLCKFRIHTSKYNSKFNENSIQESDYLIMMSNLIDNGINVRAIGLPEDLYLQNIQPWKIVKSGNFGIITYISPEENASILCTIIDEL